MFPYLYPVNDRQKICYSLPCIGCHFCQRGNFSLEAIVKSGNDYLVKVKTNQPKLYQQIETLSNRQRAQQKVTHHEKTRNRNSYRKIVVFDPPENLDPKWIGVGCVIKVERSGTRGNETYRSISYYLCSKPPQSRRLSEGIRGHWLIENSLDWVKDVIYEEDISPQTSGFAPLNLSVLKTWVLTLLRAHGFDSIKGAISEAMQRGLGGFPRRRNLITLSLYGW
ncbi:ISAs1 family transposase [Moorena sp. SIO3I8]|uniref:ISAs1 family transposase n=1 Tax=Moorena sp. SIO3I8 TaxID=2607833 RepID=UPI0013C0CAAE|nr:ISAs1 family transposase [Moorena sp. SIO3I8]NEO10216.1 ISAs1 family transposase [Moorena sp. SIO3I8]